MLNLNNEIMVPQHGNELASVSNDRAMQQVEYFLKLDKVAELFSNMTIVPEIYRGQKGNCLFALDIANRIGLPFQTVIQEMYDISGQGRITWSAKFINSLIINSGKYVDFNCVFGSAGIKSTKFKYWKKEGGQSRLCEGSIDNYEDIEAHCEAIEKRTGKKVVGPTVSIEMAIKEGWYTKNGSKWQTMPKIMLEYRAISFFSRTKCPDITMGFYSNEEIFDSIDVEPVVSKGREVNIEIVNKGTDSDELKMEESALYEEIEKARTIEAIKKIGERIAELELSPNAKDRIRYKYKAKFAELRKGQSRITKSQREYIFVYGKENGLEENEIKKCYNDLGYAHSEEIEKGKYEEVLANIKRSFEIKSKEKKNNPTEMGAYAVVADNITMANNLNALAMIKQDCNELRNSMMLEEDEYKGLITLIDRRRERLEKNAANNK